MMQRQPFGTVDEAIAIGDECWKTLGPADWHEAFSHHPRIGERVSGREASEQAGAQSAGDEIKAKLADVNQAYKKKFEHIYIVCATGKSAQELLAIAQGRLMNDPDVELKVAAEELKKIMHLRLEKIFDEHT
jgi:OHCU decarboxylase